MNKISEVNKLCFSPYSFIYFVDADKPRNGLLVHLLKEIFSEIDVIMTNINSVSSSFVKNFEEVQKALRLNCPKKCPQCGRKVKKHQTSMTIDPVLLCSNSQVSYHTTCISHYKLYQECSFPH